MRQGQRGGSEITEAAGGPRTTKPRVQLSLSQIFLTGDGLLGRLHDADDGVPVFFGVGQALEHQRHRRVARCAGVVLDLGQRALVDLLARQIHGANHGHIQLALKQGAPCQGQRDEAGALPCREAQARSAQVELAVETIGGNVGHRPHHAGRAEGRDDLSFFPLQPGLVVRRAPAAVAKLLGQAPAQPIAADLRVRLHGHQHAGALAPEHAAGLGQRLLSGLEHEQLLRQRLLQIPGRKAQVRERQLEGAGADLGQTTSAGPDQRVTGEQRPSQ